MAGMDLPVRAIREQVVERRRPDHPADPSQGRHPPHHRDHRDRRHGGRHHHHAGRLPLRLRRRRRRERASSRATCSRWACDPASSSASPTTACTSTRPSSPPAERCDDARVRSARRPGGRGPRLGRHPRPRRRGAGQRRRRGEHRPRRDGRRQRLAGPRRRRRPRGSDGRPGLGRGGRRRAPVDSTAKTISAGDVERTTVLVLDASNSMRQGDKFAAATAAVDAFLTAAPDGRAHRPGDLRRRPSARSSSPPPTTTPSRAALDGHHAAQGHRGLRRDGRRRVELVGDRRVALAAASCPTAATPSSATTLDVVDDSDATDDGRRRRRRLPGQTAENAETMLGRSPTATGGQVIPADPDALEAVFSAQADALAEQLLVTLRPSRRTSPTRSTSRVTVDAGGTTYTDSAFVSLGSGRGRPRRRRAPAGRWSARPACSLGAAGPGPRPRRRPRRRPRGDRSKSSAERRLDAYFGEGSPVAAKRRSADATADLKDSAVALTDKVVNGDLETRISQRLAGAGSALTAAEWLLLHAGIAVGAAVVGLRPRRWRCSSSSGSSLGVVVPWVYLKFRHSRRLSRLQRPAGRDARPHGRRPLRRACRSPRPSTPSSARATSRWPASSAARSSSSASASTSTDALEGVGQRMESEDFGWVVMAIRIQREVGGNLAEILHTVVRHAARAGVPAPSGQGAQRGRSPVRLHPRRPSRR